MQNEDHLIPLVAAAAPMAKNIAGDIIGKAKDLVEINSDRPIIKKRDQVTDLFKKYGYSLLDANGKSIMERFGLKQAQIPQRKFGGKDYTPEHKALYKYVQQVLIENGRASAVPLFVNSVPEYAPGIGIGAETLESILKANKPGKLIVPGSLNVKTLATGNQEAMNTAQNIAPGANPIQAGFAPSGTLGIIVGIVILLVLFGTIKK